MQAQRTICWKGHLTIREGARSARDFLEALSTGTEVTVDTSELRSVDVSHLQILVAAHNFARCLGKSLAVVAPPGGSLDMAMRSTGLSDPLDARLVHHDGAWAGIAFNGEREAA
ncbi:STAS domain-containing protein [Aquibium carbonis]|uniref:STAS domain-containing protein n=1 Tax=Aquibium carbonis TaxID=2495581 RepID=A0A3R9ZQM4_9HYPH|nr:STAS domain-containing protein [Aquibium carbonis]RST85393.1 STAS domain-containing protein [Aquibium carbonis]